MAKRRVVSEGQDPPKKRKSNKSQEKKDKGESHCYSVFQLKLKSFLQDSELKPHLVKHFTNQSIEMSFLALHGYMVAEYHVRRLMEMDKFENDSLGVFQTFFNRCLSVATDAPFKAKGDDENDQLLEESIARYRQMRLETVPNITFVKNKYLHLLRGALALQMEVAMKNHVALFFKRVKPYVKLKYGQKFPGKFVIALKKTGSWHLINRNLLIGWVTRIPTSTM
jgi:hypothetical protein